MVARWFPPTKLLYTKPVSTEMGERIRVLPVWEKFLCMYYVTSYIHANSAWPSCIEAIVAKDTDGIYKSVADIETFVPYSLQVSRKL